PSAGGAPYTYAWSNGKTTSGIQGLSAGEYEVVVTDVNGCQETLMVTVGSGVSTNEIANLTRFYLAPNPTNAVSTLELDFKEAVTVRVQLRDIVGKIFFDQQENDIRTAQYDLDLSPLASGMYFVQITVDGQVYVEKIIKNQ
ncbi:MAG: T9SS type A sorting domain-containing protein, partial [Saprospiraceae bacterium]